MLNASHKEKCRPCFFARSFDHSAIALRMLLNAVFLGELESDPILEFLRIALAEPRRSLQKLALGSLRDLCCGFIGENCQKPHHAGHDCPDLAKGILPDLEHNRPDDAENVSRFLVVAEWSCSESPAGLVAVGKGNFPRIGGGRDDIRR